MKRRRGIHWGFLIVLAVCACLAYRLFAPYEGFHGEVYVDIARGTGTGAIADQLAAAGVVRSRWDFLAARLFNRGRILQAGEYRFREAAAPLTVFDRIARGDIVFVQLVVPEGFNLFDIGAAAEEQELFKASEFVAAARNAADIRDLDPHAPTLEGYLFPDTYKLSPRTTPQKLCRIMTDRFRAEWHKLHPPPGTDVHAVVAMASLVEKESKLASERPQIAAVFGNRLRIGMKLDCDSTTIYAALLDRRYRGTIYKSDLESENPYNTYRHAGLPPGPIANPGLPSLKAALAPAESNALYFVARPDDSGSHVFSSNLAAHEAATAKYRRGIRRQVR